MLVFYGGNWEILWESLLVYPKIIVYESRTYNKRKMFLKYVEK